MKQQQRIAWLDTAKGLGIIMVILGHCVYTSSIAWNTIFAFHMPLFFILSGYLFRLKQWKNLLSSKINSLVIPYVFYSFLGLAVTLLVPQWRQALTVKGIIQDIYLLSPNHIHNSSIWFLPCLFIVAMIFHMVYKWSDGSSLKICASVVVFGIAACLLSFIEHNTDFLPCGMLPFTIDSAVAAYGFYAAGWAWHSWDDNKAYLSRQTASFICSIFLLALCVYYNGKVNLHNLTFNNPIFYITGALSGSYIVITVSKYISIHNKKLQRLLSYYGKHSLAILGTQSILIRLCILALNSATAGEFKLYHVPMPYSFGIFLAVTFLLCPVVCYMIEKIKLLSRRK